MRSSSFAEILSDTLDAHGMSPGEAARALKGLGVKIDRGTITRWRNGDTVPSVDKLEAIRRLPDVLGLSSAERDAFLQAASQALDFAITRERPRPGSPVALAQRIHFGADPLPPFAGREAELDLLQKRVRNLQSVLITGLGGIGKTRLAQEVLRSTAGYFAHGCEYLTLTPGQESDQIIHNVAQLLGVPLPGGRLTPGGRRLALAGMRDQLRDASLLFLIDGVEHADQVRDLVRELPSITWVITARRISLKSIGVYPLVLELPAHEDAAAIFLAHTGGIFDPGEEEAGLVADAVSVAGRLPIALRLVAGLLSYGFVNSRAELATWIQAGGLLRGGNHAGVLRRLFGQLVDSTPAEAQAVFEVCGAFANRTIATQRLMAVCLRAGIRPSPQIWEWLADLSLIDLPDDAHVELHPLLHKYARTRLRSSPRGAVIRDSYRSHYLRLAQTLAKAAEPRRDYGSLTSEEPNLMQVIDEFHRAGDWKRLRQMWPAVSGYLWNTGNYTGYEALDRQCLEVARLSGDREWEAVLLSELGFVALEAQRFDEADALFQESQAIHDAFPEQVIEQARLRRYRAALAMRHDRLDEALALLVECERRLSGLADPPETRLGMALVLLHSARMSTHFRRGELESAAAAGLMADRHFQEVAPNSFHRLGEYRLELADVLYLLGDAAAARDIWAGIVRERDGAAQLPEQAEAWLRLAWLAAGEGEPGAAAEYAREAGQILTRFGRVERVARAHALSAALGGEGAWPSFADLIAGCVYPAY